MENVLAEQMGGTQISLQLYESDVQPTNGVEPAGQLVLVKCTWTVSFSKSIAT